MSAQRVNSRPVFHRPYLTESLGIANCREDEQPVSIISSSPSETSLDNTSARKRRVAFLASSNASDQPIHNCLGKYTGDGDCNYEQAAAILGQNSDLQGSDTREENLEDMYRRASIVKEEAQARGKPIPPFIQKLSRLLEEPANAELIRWSEDGNSFIVLDEDAFAKVLVPEYFKHNNYASFVRQLNMYGFRKVVRLSDTSLRAQEKKNSVSNEYLHSYFKRGHPHLLWLIHKPKSKANEKISGHESPSMVAGSPLMADRLSDIERELDTVRRQQVITGESTKTLQSNNEHLHALAAKFHEQHTQHENSINAIITYLMSFYHRGLQGPDEIQGASRSHIGDIQQQQGEPFHSSAGDISPSEFLLADPNVHTT